MRTREKYNHTMDKKRMKITLKVLNDVKQEYPGTNIEDRQEYQYRRPSRRRVFEGHYISRRDNFSFYIPGSKELASTGKYFLFCSAKF